MVCCNTLRQKTQRYREKNFKKNNKKLLKSINKGIKEEARKGIYVYTAQTNQPLAFDERELLIEYYTNLGYRGHWCNENEFIINWG